MSSSQPVAQNQSDPMGSPQAKKPASPKKKSKAPKVSPYYQHPPIPEHGFFDPWLLIEIASIFSEDDIKPLLKVAKPTPPVENNIKLLLLVLTEKGKKTINWSLFQTHNSNELLIKIKSFNILSVPAWKVQAIKDQMDQPWFDETIQKQASNVCYLTTIWMKAVVQSWDALANILKTENKISEADLANAKLENYLQVTMGPKILARSVDNPEFYKSLQELKVFRAPPQGVIDVASCALNILGEFDDWSTFFTKVCHNPRVSKERLTYYNIGRLTEQTYQVVKRKIAERDLSPEMIAPQSIAAGSLMCWILDIMDCYEKMQQVKDSPEALQKMSVQVYSEPMPAEEKAQHQPKLPVFADMTETAEKQGQQQPANKGELSMSSPARPRTSNVSSPKKKSKGPGLPQIPQHGFFDPWLLLQISSQVKMNDLIELQRMAKVPLSKQGTPDFEDNIKLLLLVLSGEKEKRPINWSLFQSLNANELITKWKSFNILSIPSWKVQAIKDQSGKPWFDEHYQRKYSMTLCLTTIWLKAVVYNWDALANILKTEKKMSDADLANIKLENYLQITMGPEQVRNQNVINAADFTELKAFKKPPENVKQVAACVLIAVKGENQNIEWPNFQKAANNPNAFAQEILNYDCSNLTQWQYDMIKQTITEYDLYPEIIAKNSAAAESLMLWTQGALDCYEKMQEVKGSPENLQNMSVQVLQEPIKADEQQSEFPKMPKFGEISDEKQSSAKNRRLNPELSMSSPARPRTSIVSSPKKKSKGPGLPQIPQHGFFDPWLLLQISSQVVENDLKELKAMAKAPHTKQGTPDFEDNIKLLLLVLSSEKEKRPINWSLFQSLNANELLANWKSFNILSIPSWKVKAIKEQFGKPWFDENHQKKASMVLCLATIWLKAVVYNWDALANILKTEKKMSDADFANVKLENYLQITMGPEQLGNQVENSIKASDLQELKSLKSPPVIVGQVGVCVLIAIKGEQQNLQWNNFQKAANNPSAFAQEALSFDVTRFTKWQYDMIKQMIEENDLNPGLVKAKSAAAESLILWTLNILDCYEKMQEVKGSPENLQKMSVQVLQEPVKADEQQSEFPKMPTFGEVSDDKQSPAKSRKMNGELSLSMRSPARPRTSNISSPKKKAKGPGLPQIPSHGFFDPWLLHKISSQVVENDVKELQQMRTVPKSKQGTPDFEDNVKLLLLILSDQKEKRPINWELFRLYKPYELVAKMNTCRVLSIPVWKVQAIKGQMGKPWFDEHHQLKASKALAIFTLWLKAIVYNWDALANILKTEKKMSDADLANVKLENHLQITFGQDYLQRNVCDPQLIKQVQELKALGKPPQICVYVGVMVLIAYKGEKKNLEWPNFQKAAANPAALVQGIQNYDIGSFTKWKYEAIKQLLSEHDFSPDVVVNKSMACKMFVLWIQDILYCYEKMQETKDQPETLQKISVEVYDQPLQADEPQPEHQFPKMPTFGVSSDEQQASPQARKRMGRQMSLERIPRSSEPMQNYRAPAKLSTSIRNERNSISNIRSTGQIQPVLEQSREPKSNNTSNMQVNEQAEFKAKMSMSMPFARPKPSKTYGGVAPLNNQQEIFAARMEQMRREAQMKYKQQYARVKRVNDAILAEDESRQQVTYERLYQKGTRKLLDIKDGTYYSQNNADEEEAWGTPTRSPGAPDGADQSSPSQMQQSPYQ